MKDGEGLADGVVGAGGVVGRAISLAEASRIAGEVGEMIRAHSCTVDFTSGLTLQCRSSP